MTAFDFFKLASRAGLQIGFKKDYQFVESLDSRKCAILVSEEARRFIEEAGLQKEITPNGIYLVYFSA